MLHFAEAARELGVGHATLRSWLNKGVVECLRDRNNHCLWTPEQIAEIKSRIVVRTHVFLGPALKKPKKPKPPVATTVTATP